MNSLVFDSGPLISLTSNSLLWILEPLKKFCKGEFIIPESVKSELVEEPLLTKKFRFEAFQVNELFQKGVLKIHPDKPAKEKTLALLDTANKIFWSKKRNLTIVHYAEISAIVTANMLESPNIVMDERVTRELIEHPLHLAKIIERKIRSKITIDKKRLEHFSHSAGNINVIRSSELAAVACEKGLLDRYAFPKTKRTEVLESVLWGLKIEGCAINQRGIKAIVSTESKKKPAEKS